MSTRSGSHAGRPGRREAAIWNASSTVVTRPAPTIRRAHARAARATQEGEIRDGLATKQSALLAWCRASYVEAFTSWVHLSAVRVFTESIMRFGLPPQFLATLIRPQPKCEKKLRTTLSGLFAGKDAHHWQETEDTTAASMGVGALSADDMHPYVSLTLTLAGTS